MSSEFTSNYDITISYQWTFVTVKFTNKETNKVFKQEYIGGMLRNMGLEPDLFEFWSILYHLFAKFENRFHKSHTFIMKEGTRKMFLDVYEKIKTVKEGDVDNVKLLFSLEVPS